MSDSVDVLVVGAGPAGVTASFFLKHFDKEGKFSVKLIEKLNDLNYDTYHRICGEGISKTAFDELSPLKPAGILEKIKFIYETYPENIIIKNNLPGYILNRFTFFSKIISDFNKLGGKFQQQILQDFFFNNGKIKVKYADGSFEKFDFIIAADGASSPIRKKLGIINPDIRVFLQYIIDQEVIHDSIYFFYDEIYEGDYKYIFPNGESTAKIGYPLIANKPFPKPEKILLKHARAIGFSGVNKMVEKNVMLVGDAAGLTNPITKGGIRSAMVSGKMAAEALIKEDPLDYERQWKTSFYADPIINDTYLFLKNASNRELVHLMKRANADNLTVQEKKILAGFKLCEEYGW